MRCRGFDGQFRSLTTFQTRWTDAALFIAIVVIEGAILTWDLLARS
jgi:energy-coupling factor transporter transmembrane protein EcfT